jgi:pyruvate dehydrogenase (quinone)
LRFAPNENPDFGKVAKAIGLWGHSASKVGELEESIQTWLTQPGPAPLYVKVNPMQLVMPPSPLVSPEAVVGMAVYSARTILQGKGHDVWEMMLENIP